MKKYDKKALLCGVFYGVILLFICIAQFVFFGMDKICGTVLFGIALFSTFYSAIRWYLAYDQKYKSSKYISDHIPRFVDDPYINSLVINVYKWFLILPIIGILTI